MTPMPCPNPTCTHRFSANEVKGATALKCPRCGTVFQFRPGRNSRAALTRPPSSAGASSAPARAPVAPPVTPPKLGIPVGRPAPPARPATPIAQPAAPPTAPPTAPLVAQPVRPAVSPVQPPAILQDHGAEGLTSGAASDVELVDKAEPLVRPRAPRKFRSVKPFVVGGVILALAAGAVLVVYLNRDLIFHFGSSQSAGQDEVINGEIFNARNAKEKVVRLVMSRGAWKQDNPIRSGLKAIVAIRRTEPDVWVAVAAKDYGPEKPRNAELLKEAKERLENHFGETLELSEKAEDKDFAGQRVLRLEFKGETKQVAWHGECLMLPHHGIGYWFFIAAPTLEEAQQELLEVQKDKRGFVLSDSRAGWRPQPPKMETFHGTKLPFTVQAPDGVWEKFPAEDQDEKGDLFLFGKYIKEKDNRKNASVLVIALEKQPGLKQALKAVRSYFEEKIEEEDKDNKVVPVSEKAGDAGFAGAIGTIPGRFLDLKVQRGTQATRYILLGVANAGDRTLAFRCQSVWENRQIWRQDFLDLLGSFQVRKSGQ